MTGLVKRTLPCLTTQTWFYAKTWNYTHENNGHYWSNTTKVFPVWKLSSLKNKLEVYLTYKNYVINSGRTPFYTSFHFPEDIKYRLRKNKAGKKLEGNTLANTSVYKVYVERSSTKVFSRSSE